MTTSAVRSFTDPDDYASSIRATQYRLTLTGRGKFYANLVRIDLHDLWMQRFATNLPFVAHAQNITGRAIVVFRAVPGAALYRGAAEMSMREVVRLSEGQGTFQRATGAASWASMSLPLTSSAMSYALMSGADLAPPKHPCSEEPSQDDMLRLQRVHAAAAQLAIQAPEVLQNTNATLGLEQSLIQALTACLTSSKHAEDSAARRRHDFVMRRFHAAIVESGNQPVYISELCLKIGVSDTTLRACCLEHLGMSPLRYLWLRRMQLARQALRRADAKSASVTSIALDHGFWELGRFSVSYRELYGEAPSATLNGNC